LPDGASILGGGLRALPGGPKYWTVFECWWFSNGLC